MADNHAIEWRTRYPACPLCSGLRVAKVGRAKCDKHYLYQPGMPDTMQWIRCIQCGHIFTDGYFTDEALQRIFSNTQPMHVAGADFEDWRPISARMIQRVSRYR